MGRFDLLDGADFWGRRDAGARVLYVTISEGYWTTQLESSGIFHNSLISKVPKKMEYS